MGSLVRRIVPILTPVVLLLLWPLGAMLLWLQAQWPLRDRIIGTLAVPAGWLTAWFIATGVRTDCPSDTRWASLTGGSGCIAPLAYQITHPTPWWGFNHVFGPILLLALIALPIFAAAYLEIRLLRSDRHAVANVR